MTSEAKPYSEEYVRELELQNLRLKEENELLASRLRDVDKEIHETEEKALKSLEDKIQPLRNKLHVAEQALLLNSNLYFKHMEEGLVKETGEKPDVVLHSNIYFNNFEEALEEREKEIDVLKTKLKDAEQKLKQTNFAEILPLQQKLRIAEQALLFYSDYNLNQLASPTYHSHHPPAHTPNTTPTPASAPTSTTAPTPTETTPNTPTSTTETPTATATPTPASQAAPKPTVPPSPVALVAASNVLSQETGSQTASTHKSSSTKTYSPVSSPQSIDKEREIARLRGKLKEAELKANQAFEAEILPLKQKLHVAEQALLFNANMYFNQLQSYLKNESSQKKDQEIKVLEEKLKKAEERIRQTEVEIVPLKQKLRVAEQALLFNSDQFVNLTPRQVSDQNKELEQLRSKLAATEAAMKHVIQSELLPLKQKLIVAEQALLFNSSMYYQHHNPKHQDDKANDAVAAH